jgi:hypothetical protein
MAVDADNVVVGVTGAIYQAPIATTLPTNSATALNVAFKELGYVSEEGVSEANGTSTNNIKAWQNGTVVRKVQTEHDVTYTFTLIETNPEVLAAYYGNYATGKVEVNAKVLPNKRWVIDVLDGTSKIRIVIPNGQVTERGTVSYVNAGVASYQLTITAFEDTAYAGSLGTPAKAYIYYSTEGAPSA